MWVTKLLIFPVEIRIFCPKTTKFGPKLAFLVIFGQALPAHLVPCWCFFGGCGARAVSRKTPIYFISVDQRNAKNVLCVQLLHLVQKIEVKDSAIKFLKEQGILKTSVKFKCGCDLATIKQRTGTGYYYFRCAKCDSMTSIRLLLLILHL